MKAICHRLLVVVMLAIVIDHGYFIVYDVTMVI